MTSAEILAKLYDLLGSAVFLPIPLKEKGPQLLGWQKTTYEQTQERAYRDQLIEAIERHGNIGVLLGPASNRLLALDLDDDALIDKWIDASPWLANTLRTKGKRGCQFWLRLEPGCEYPNGKGVHLFDAARRPADAKTAVGELRLGSSGGAQSVIFGVHPTVCATRSR